jgi:hypothetical protein
MTWTITIGGTVQLKPAASPPFPVLPQDPVNRILDKLTRAVSLASEMAEAAETAIEMFAVVPPNQQMHTGNAEVMDALVKYFHLYPYTTPAPLYKRTVDGIVYVFKRIKDGLAGGYTLYIYTAPNPDSRDAGKQGYCMVNTKANFALGKLFLFPGDHVPWNQLQAWAKGENITDPSQDIHLKYEFLERESEDVIAKTIVHEASHKWAYTTDVLYKHASFAKTNEGENFRFVVDQGWQHAVERFATDSEKEVQKPLYPMTAHDKPKVATVGENQLKKLTGSLLSEAQKQKQLDDLSQKEMWVKNADSYAYTARRLWKRELTIAAAASMGCCSSFKDLRARQGGTVFQLGHHGTVEEELERVRASLRS